MNPYISELLRARYAMNSLLSALNLYSSSNEYNHISKEIQDELFLPIYEEKEGKRYSTNGKYLAQIFMDMNARIGINITNPNLRKRIMGIMGNQATYTPDILYRDAITKYLGVASWQTLEKDAEKLYKRLIYDIRMSQISSAFGSISKSFSIKTYNLNEGDMVKLCMSEGTGVTLVSKGNCMFKVKETKGLSIFKDDILRITTPFISKNRLYAESCLRNGHDKGEYLSQHTIINHKLIKGEKSMQLDKKNIDAILARAEEKRKLREKNEQQKTPSNTEKPE